MRPPENYTNEPDNLPPNTERLQLYLQLSFLLPRSEAQLYHGRVSLGNDVLSNCIVGCRQTEINVRPRNKVFEENESSATILGEFGKQDLGTVAVDKTVSILAHVFSEGMASG